MGKKQKEEAANNYKIEVRKNMLKCQVEYLYLKKLRAEFEYLKKEYPEYFTENEIEMIEMELSNIDLWLKFEKEN